MKKLLLTLSSVLVVGGTASSVVSCGVKPEKEVIFMLFGTTSSSGDQEKRKNFQDLADAYNKIHQSDENFVPVKVVMKNSNYLDLAIQSGDNLPDLYVSYVDAAATYVDSSVGNKVRDMKKSMGDGFDKFNKDLITPAFMEEGQYRDEQIVLPFGKSFDISVINVNLFIQFMELFPELKETVETLKINFEKYNEDRKSLLGGSEEWTATKVFKEGLTFRAKDNAIDSDTNSIELDKELFTDLVKSLQGISSVEEIKDFFNSTQNVLNVADAFREVVSNNKLDVKVTLNEENKKVITTTDKYHFAFGIDSLDNKYYMDYAATTAAQEGVINVQNSIDKPTEDFWYSTNYENKIANIELNPYSQGFVNTTEYLQGMKDIALKNGDNSITTDWRDQWNGVFSTARKSNSTQNWVTEDFVKSTMFMASASSANDIYFTDQFKNKDVIDEEGKPASKTYRPVSKADVITTATTNGNDTNKNVFLSQGRGIAGFQSEGKNAVEKEKTVEGFLIYIMQPIQTAQYGLKTSYMPATKSGIKIYESYLNGSYNNTTGNIGSETKLIEVIRNIEKEYNGNEITEDKARELIPVYFSQILNSTGAPELKAGVSSVISSFIKDYLDPLINENQDEASNKVALVSSKAIPTTNIIRSSLKPTLTGSQGLLDLTSNSANSRDAKMTELLVDGNNTYNLTRWIRTYTNKEFFKEINIKITKQK